MKKKLKFLLVCEGPTDISFLKSLTAKIAQQLDSTIEIKELSPQTDATTGQYPPHGWTMVKNWCRRYKTKWKGLLAISKADGLIIQMDTDIAEKIPFDDIKCNFAIYQGTRRNFCEKVMLSWLEEIEASRNLYLLLPSFAIETWLLATHSPNETVFDDLEKPFNYEALNDFEMRLVNLGYKSKTSNGKKRIDKNARKYEQYGVKTFNQLDDVKSRCSEARMFFDYLSNIN